VRRWLAAYEQLLRGAVTDRRAADRPAAGPDRGRPRQLAAWNQTEAPYPRATRIEALIAATARRHPLKPAVHHGDAGTLTYAELAAPQRLASPARWQRRRDPRRPGRPAADRDQHLLPRCSASSARARLTCRSTRSFPAERLALHDRRRWRRWW
jgi:hypothetical protein